MPNWFYIDANGRKQGPVTGGQLKGLAKAGRITPDTIVETEDGKTAPAGKVKGLTFVTTEQPKPSPVAPSPSPAAPPAPAPPTENDPWDWGIPASEVSSLITESQAPSAPPPKAAASPQKRQQQSRRRSSGNIRTYLTWSIITTLCCFPLLGVPAIIFSVLCGSDLKSGNYDSAAKRSSIAFYCNVIGLLLACLQIGLVLLLPAIQAGRMAAERVRLQNTLQDARSNPEPYLERRANFKTKLTKTGKAPQEWGNDPLPRGVEKIKYPSGDFQLEACLYIPPGGREQKNPALVFFHGGFAHDNDDILACDIFMSAGYVVLAPALRAESGGPGNFELFLGEVDDAANAVRWLAQQPYVDSERIYTFGHSVGGGISCLLSLMDNVPIKHGGSSGGLYNPIIISAWKSEGYVPFNPKIAKEVEMRLLLGNVRWMKRPHHAYLGTVDAPFDISVELAQSEMKNENINNMLFISRIPGDHFTSFNPAIRHYLSIAQRDNRGNSSIVNQTIPQPGQATARPRATPQTGRTPVPPMDRPAIDHQVKVQRLSTHNSLTSISFILDNYHRHVGQYPTTEQGLDALFVRPANLPASANWRGPYIAPPFQKQRTTDIWGNTYRYASPGKNGRKFDIWSLGPDGKDGTEDDVGLWMELRDL